MARRTRHTVNPASEVHVTGRQVFKRCRLKYHFSSVQGLRPRGARNLPLAMGVAFHEGCAALFEGFRDLDFPRGEYWTQHANLDPHNSGELHRLHDRAMKAMLDSWEEELPRKAILEEYGDTEKWDASQAMLISMFEQYYNKLITEPFWDEVVAVEYPLKKGIKLPAHLYPKPTPEMEARDRGYPARITLRGTLDVVVRREGKLWIVDHKTAGQFRDEDDLMLDDQMTAYMYLAEHAFKKKLGGAIYSQVRKKIPVEPQLLQSGKALSKQIKDTTYEMYMAAIKRHGFDPAEYYDVLINCRNNEFVRQSFIPRYQSRLDQFVTYLAAELSDMTNPQRVWYPSAQWDCSRYCDYYLLCRLRQEGGDESILREQNFDVVEGGGKIYRR